MFAKLRQIIGSNDPDEVIASDLQTMMAQAAQLVRHGGRVFDGETLSPEQREAFYASDQAINQLEQKIRRQVVSRVTLSSPTHRTRLLAFLSLVKDVERLGDYAKNLVEAAELLPRPPPGNGVPEDLAQIRSEVEAILDEAHSVLDCSDEKRAWILLDRGYRVSVRCDALVASLARSSLSAAVAVPSALAARYYKRVAKHLMNLLSSVVMPLDRIGYYDGSERPP